MKNLRVMKHWKGGIYLSSLIYVSAQSSKRNVNCSEKVGYECRLSNLTKHKKQQDYSDVCIYCRLPTKLRQGDVFDPVYLFTGGGEGPHMTITHDALESPYRDPPNPASWTQEPRTCSNLFNLGLTVLAFPSADIWWLLKRTNALASGQYASDWNAFLFYRLQMKLRECNVFTGVCLFIGLTVGNIKCIIG